MTNQARDDLSRISATPEARDALNRAAEEHGPLILHTSGGRIGGRNYPICLPRDWLRIGARDHLLGRVEGVPVYEMEDRADFRLRSGDFVLDVEFGPSIGFSIAAGPGKRFSLLPANLSSCACQVDQS